MQATNDQDSNIWLHPTALAHPDKLTALAIKTGLSPYPAKNGAGFILQPTGKGSLITLKFLTRAHKLDPNGGGGNAAA